MGWYEDQEIPRAGYTDVRVRRKKELGDFGFRSMTVDLIADYQKDLGIKFRPVLP